MERAKKFGTFGGVFTPSLLTILGVIMYLRLGWIVGQAGLLYTVIIILIAHVISVTTGLSLSSIATDKKIRAGGIYYMLSRSLGLPIGGAIGTTIFLAIALSISLYLVGFSESFLAVDFIRELTGLEQNIHSYRITATIVLIILTILAFISTSLAIKLQYFVLTAIGLSLVSVFAGFFINTGFHPSFPSVSISPTAPSLDVLFAVFFPAVTGFTVGVSMSGDLKNPKSSIPIGTMGAIITGLIIYLALAMGFGFFVDRQLLIEDSSFLMKVSLIPVLLIAGIWGATLSSALGGILGGPRIVQALASDKLAPGILSKGFGINNEPRTAIILTFLIAQAGILIGDLNTIARVVSMFFITAYGFINLAFALESWASTDFRPSFKIPRWVGWLGFAASIMVMMQIDVLAMIVAFILIWLVWFAMRRRAQQLEPGDVWQSVWARVARQSLHNMYTKGIEERNWKPNILMFSGNPETYPNLVELGKTLIANHGLLTIVNLKTYTQGEKARPRFQQNLSSSATEKEEGIFTREYYCHNAYDGIRLLSETYGFAGVEPNTVLMGWAGRDSDPIRYAEMVKHIIELDLNLLLMHYDMQKGFGERKTIDIWWRGSGNNGNLAINLVKFLWLSDRWKDSRLRLMIENPVNDERENIYNFATEVLDNLRVNAEIMILNNEIEKKPFYDIIRIESKDSDIIFLGMPDIEKGKEEQFVVETNKLFNDLGSLVLIKASTQFKRLNIGLKNAPDPAHAKNLTPLASLESGPGIPLSLPKKEVLAMAVNSFSEKSDEVINEMIQKCFAKPIRQYGEIIKNAHARVDSTYTVIEKKLADNSLPHAEKLKTFYKLTNNTNTRYEQILLQLKDTLLPEQKKNMEVFFDRLDTRFNDIIQELPEKLTISWSDQELDPGLLPVHLQWKRKFSAKKDLKIKVAFRKIISLYYPNTWQDIRKKTWQNFNSFSNQYIIEQQKTFKEFRDGLHRIESAFRKGELTPEMIIHERGITEENFSSLNSFLTQYEKKLSHLAREQDHFALERICLTLDAVNPNKQKNKEKPLTRMRRQDLRNMDSFPEDWLEVQQLLINQSQLEIILSTIEYKIWHLTEHTAEELKAAWFEPGKNSILHLPEKIIRYCKQSIDLLNNGKSITNPDFEKLPTENLHLKIKDIEDFARERVHAVLGRIPSHIDLLKPDASYDFTIGRVTAIEKQTVEVSRLLHFIVQNDLTEPIQFEFRDLSFHISRLEPEIEEIARLIRYTCTQDKEEPLQIQLNEFLEQQKKRAEKVYQRINSLFIGIDDKLHSALNKTSRQLSLSIFLKTAHNLRLLEKSKSGTKQKIPAHIRLYQNTREYFRRHLVSLWYDRTKRIVYAHQTRIDKEEHSFPVSKMHRLNEAVSTKQDILQKIPTYYQQLFLRKNNYFMDFWYGKPRELEEAKATIIRHANGFNGALMVRGEHNSGKSFFVNYITHKYLENRPVYSVYPPFAGSSGEADFLRALQKATDQAISAEKIFSNLPERSVIIIEDLELWWEKALTGLKVIQTLCSYIERYGNKILFIITANSHAYRSINRFLSIDSYMLSIIDCNPFNAEELKNIILQRHRSGNMQFILRNKKESEIRSWDVARLFNSYFNYTRGNVGLCLQTWISCIEKVDGNMITIREPKRPDTTVLNRLNAGTLVFLVQFILHKRMNYDKIQRVMMMSAGEVQKKVKLLKRAAIIIEPNPGVFALNPNLHAFIRERFIEKELL
ncbi:MAG: hypothetical protein ACOC12_01935 [Bacteroidota bacterium]